MTNIAIIPAREGSKRIKNKNIKSLNGKPLIFWTIEEALKSKKIDQIYISTNSKKIKNIVFNNYKIEIKRLRPENLASDNTKMISVIKDVVKNSENKFKNIILLQPTSPLRSHLDIDDAIDLFTKSKADSLVSITEFISPFNLKKIVTKNSRNLVSDFNINKKFQKIYVRNGPAILITKKNNINRNKLYGNKTIGYNMPFERSIDINTLDDFKLASRIMKFKI